MSIGTTKSGKRLYTSARDIGNIAAGYMAGAYGIPWGIARKKFDGLQSQVNGRASVEGMSSQNAQYLGWQLGINELTNSPVVGLPVMKFSMRWMNYLINKL